MDGSSVALIISHRTSFVCFFINGATYKMKQYYGINSSREESDLTGPPCVIIKAGAAEIVT